MNAKPFIGLAAALALSGCLTFGQFETNLAALKGQPAQAAFDVLGYPDAQQQFGSETVYTWATNSTGAMVLPTTSTTTASVGGKPVMATTTGSQVVPMHLSCKVKLIADEEDVIRKYQFEGNAGGCEGYMRALHKAAGK